MSAHTPGPWIATPPCREERMYHWTIRGPGNHPSVISFEVARLSSANTPELEHDARLIAAAPELLSWLAWSLNNLSSDAKQSGQYDMARAVLAKATGEQA